MQDIDVADEAYVFAVDSDGDIIASPTVKSDQTVFENIMDEGTDTSIIADKILSGEPGIELLNTNYYVYAPIENVKWVICVKFPETLIKSNRQKYYKHDGNIYTCCICYAHNCLPSSN